MSGRCSTFLNCRRNLRNILLLESVGGSSMSCLRVCSHVSISEGNGLSIDMKTINQDSWWFLQGCSGMQRKLYTIWNCLRFLPKCQRANVVNHLRRWSGTIAWRMPAVVRGLFCEMTSLTEQHRCDSETASNLCPLQALKSLLVLHTFVSLLHQFGPHGRWDFHLRWALKHGFPPVT